MELLINLGPELADRRRKPPDFSHEKVNGNNGKNQKEGSQGKGDRSRALLSAFSPHLPPLRNTAGPTPKETNRSASTEPVPLFRRQLKSTANSQREETSYTSAP